MPFEFSRRPLWATGFAMLSSFVAYGYSFDRTNLFNQIPAIVALTDTGLFSRDFYIQEMIGFTPRFYYYQLMLFFHRLGLSLPVIALFLFLLAFGSMILGLWAIGESLGRSPFSGLALAFLGLAATDGTVGITDIFRIEPIAAVYAMGIAIWGIFFCCHRRWGLGYLLFGLACLLQFLIGFLPACLWGMSLLLETVFRGRLKPFLWAFLSFSLLVACVYVPMVATGNTSSSVLSDRDFVQLYGYIRHPHHIIFSSFPAKEWQNFACLTGAGLLGLRLSKKLTPDLKRDLTLTIVSACGLLMLGYVFVEQVPLALIAKLQFARVTPFVMITVWIAVSVLASEYHQRKNYPVSLLLLALPVVDWVGPAMLLLLTAALWLTKLLGPRRFLQPVVWLQKIRLSARRGVAIAYSLFLLTLLACWAYLPVFFASLAFPLLQQPRPTFFRRSKPYVQTATVGLSIYLCLHLSGIISDAALTPLHRDITLYMPAENALSQAAIQFAQVSPVDALILVPPSDETFRFYSQRSVVATFKSFPFTDEGILTWQSRLSDILGPLDAKMMSPSYTSDLYRQRSSQALSEIANTYGADYILTQETWHPDIAGTVIIRVGEWEIWQLTSDAASNPIRSDVRG